MRARHAGPYSVFPSLTMLLHFAADRTACTSTRIVGVRVSCFAWSHSFAQKAHNRGGVLAHAPITQRPLPFSSRCARTLCGRRLVVGKVTRVFAPRQEAACKGGTTTAPCEFSLTLAECVPKHNRSRRRPGTRYSSTNMVLNKLLMGRMLVQAGVQHSATRLGKGAEVSDTHTFMKGAEVYGSQQARMDLPRSQRVVGVGL
jgi:hypothetical protein